MRRIYYVLTYFLLNFVAIRSQESQMGNQPAYNYTEGWYDGMPVDHFSYTNGDTFKLKFVYNLDSYQKGGPIFFYTGNQERIEVFINNTGIIWDIAPLFHAAVVFAEHRYYGESLPYGNHSFDDASTLGFLSTSQVLADYATLIPWFKKNFSIPEDTHVIAFGGSYGSMLATWFRLKYPNVVYGTYASSPPLLWLKPGAIDIGAFDRWTTKTFLESGCDRDTVQAAFKALYVLPNALNGLDIINQVFKLSENSKLSSPSDVDTYLEPWIRNAFEQLAAADYPYNTSFYDVLPGWSVNISCEFLKKDAGNDEDRITNLFKAVQVYYGYSDTYCVKNCPEATWARIFNWQTCTEFIAQTCPTGPPNDFFVAKCTNSSDLLSAKRLSCNQSYAGYSLNMFRPNAVELLYGFDFSQTSNIIFTQGSIDPYASGGLTDSTPGLIDGYKRGIYNFHMARAAHHLDLRQPNLCDPIQVQNARYQIVKILQCWLTPEKYTHCSSYPYPPEPLPKDEFYGGACDYVLYQYPWGQNTTEGTSSPLVGSTPSNGSTSFFLSLFLIIALYIVAFVINVCSFNN